MNDIPSLLEEYKKANELVKDPRFHGNRSWVPVGMLAMQYFCEAKVEMVMMHGDIETETKATGRDMHEEIIKMENTTLRNIEENIKKQPFYLCSFPLIGYIHDLVIIGKPDMVCFSRGKPSCLIEVKTASKMHYPYKTQLVQAMLYGLLLEEMKFDCSDLTICLPIVLRSKNLKEELTLQLGLLGSVYSKLRLNPPKGKFSELDKKHLSEFLKKGPFSPIADLIESGSLKVFMTSYDRKICMDAVSWAKDYWLNKRNPVPTKNPKKCGSCEYLKFCEYSPLKKPSSDYKRLIGSE